MERVSSALRAPFVSFPPISSITDRVYRIWLQRPKSMVAVGALTLVSLLFVGSHLVRFFWSYFAGPKIDLTGKSFNDLALEFLTTDHPDAYCEEMANRLKGLHEHESFSILRGSKDYILSKSGEYSFEQLAALYTKVHFDPKKSLSSQKEQLMVYRSSVIEYLIHKKFSAEELIVSVVTLSPTYELSSFVKNQIVRNFAWCDSSELEDQEFHEYLQYKVLMPWDLAMAIIILSQNRVNLVFDGDPARLGPIKKALAETTLDVESYRQKKAELEKLAPGADWKLFIQSSIAAYDYLIKMEQ